MTAIKKNSLVGEKYILHFKRPLELEKLGETYVVRSFNLSASSIISLTNLIEKMCIRFYKSEGKILDEYEIELKKSMDTYLDNLEEIKEEKKKKRINSKKKGSSNELKLSKVLTEKMKCQIYRSPGSGAYSTSHGLKSSAGDFLSEDVDGVGYKIFNRFNIEAKHYKELSLLEIYWKKSCPIISFIEQASGDAKRTDKEFCLIIKSNNSPYFMILEEESCKGNKNKEIVTFSYDGKKYRIYILEEFDFFS